LSSRQDKELQIRLAELQMDLQINITYLFGIDGIIMALFVGLYQATLASEDIIRIVLIISLTFLMCLFVLVAVHYIREIERIRRQTRKLRKEYVW